MKASSSIIHDASKRLYHLPERRRAVLAFVRVGLRANKDPFVTSYIFVVKISILTYQGSLNLINSHDFKIYVTYTTHIE